MKRTQISSLTAEQAADELTLLEVKRLLQKARKAHQNAEQLEHTVLQALDDMCMDLDAPFHAGSASTLQDAVRRYLQSEEYSLKTIMAEIRAKYTKYDDQ